MLRLTGGEFRGRLIRTPHSSEKTRPTQAKLRQALFNSLQMRIPDATILDLFAGSGALGFEALSRGASHVTFVESARSAVRLVAENARELGVEPRVTILADELSLEAPARVSARLSGPFDVVLADPPYAAGWELPLILLLPWDQLLAPGGVFCLEWGVQKSRFQEMPEKTPHLAKVREKIYGDSVLSTYERFSECDNPERDAPSEGGEPELR